MIEKQRVHLIYFSPDIAAGRPDNKDKEIQHRFGRDIYDKGVVQKDYIFKTRLKIHWASDNRFTSFKCAVGSILPANA